MNNLAFAKIHKPLKALTPSVESKKRRRHETHPQNVQKKRKKKKKCLNYCTFDIMHSTSNEQHIEQIEQPIEQTAVSHKRRSYTPMKRYSMRDLTVVSDGFIEPSGAVMGFAQPNEQLMTSGAIPCGTDQSQRTLISYKYRPRTRKQMKGNEKTIDSVYKWVKARLKSHSKSRSHKPWIAIFHGPPGVGKSTLCDCLASDFKLMKNDFAGVDGIMQWTGFSSLSDGVGLNRSSGTQAFEQFLNQVLFKKSARSCGENPLIVLDQLEEVESAKMYQNGLVDALLNICAKIDDQKRPVPQAIVIGVVNNLNQTAMRKLLASPHVIRFPFYSHREKELRHFCYRVGQKEHLNLSSETIHELVRCSRGDFRQLLIQMDMLKTAGLRFGHMKSQQSHRRCMPSASIRDIEPENDFKLTRAVITGNNLQNQYRIMHYDPETAIAFLFENFPRAISMNHQHQQIWYQTMSDLDTIPIEHRDSTMLSTWVTNAVNTCRTNYHLPFRDPYTRMNLQVPTEFTQRTGSRQRTKPNPAMSCPSNPNPHDFFYAAARRDVYLQNFRMDLNLQHQQQKKTSNRRWKTSKAMP